MRGRRAVHNNRGCGAGDRPQLEAWLAARVLVVGAGAGSTGQPVVIAALDVTANHRCWAPLVGALTPAARWSHPTPGAEARVRRSPTRSASTHTPTTRLPSSTASAPAPQPSSGTPWGLVTVSCAARYPERIGRVVLVEGGLPLGAEAPAESTIDDVLQAVLGPALGRLRRTFTNHASYHRYLRQHPALRDPEFWTPKSTRTSTAT